MILFRSNSGYGVPTENFSYKTIWTIGEIKSPIKFLSWDLDLSKLVDVKFDGIDIEIFHYPHNGKEFITDYSPKTVQEALEANITGRFKNLVGRIITINIETFEFITIKHFEGISRMSQKVCGFVGFTYNLPSGGFPKIYVCEKTSYSDNNQGVFDTITESSRYVTSPVNHATTLGKYLLFKLHMSAYGIAKEPNHPPLSQVPFSYNERWLPQSTLDVEDLIKIAQSKGNTLKKTTKGITDTTSLVSTRETAVIIQKQILDRGSVLFTSMLDYGVQETLDINPLKDVIISVELDLSGIARKACLFEGKIYIIPIERDFDYETYIGIPDDSLILCSEETFPKKTSKMEKKETK